jgi:hypothetical protein
MQRNKHASFLPLRASKMNCGMEKAKAEKTIARIAAHTFTLQPLRNTAHMQPT